MDAQDLHLDLLSRAGTGKTVRCAAVFADLRPFIQVPEMCHCSRDHHVHIHVVDSLCVHVLMPTDLALLGATQTWKVPDQIAVVVRCEHSSIWP